MRIKWYGTASLLIESGDTRLLVDPYLKTENPGLPRVPVEEAASADAIFITHPHFDHFSDVAAFLNGNVREVFVSERGLSIARENGIPDGKMTELDANRQIRVGGITVQTFRSRHCRFDLGTILSVALNPVTYFHFGQGVRILKKTKHYRITDRDIFALEFLAEGKRVMVFGSAGMDDRAEYPENADLFVMPYQGRMRMHRYAARFLKEFRPKRVMIDHFDDAFPPISRTVKTKKLLPALQKVLPDTEAFVPVENEWYEV